MMICIKCKKEMKCTQTGRWAVWHNSHVYSGDEYTCPNCEVQLLRCATNAFHQPNAIEHGNRININPINMTGEQDAEKETRSRNPTSIPLTRRVSGMFKRRTKAYAIAMQRGDELEKVNRLLKVPTTMMLERIKLLSGNPEMCTICRKEAEKTYGELSRIIINTYHEVLKMEQDDELSSELNILEIKHGQTRTL